MSTCSFRNLVDSPNCACGQVESTSHFLISCKKYTDLRNELMYTINYPVTIDLNLLTKGVRHLKCRSKYRHFYQGTEFYS